MVGDEQLWRPGTLGVRACLSAHVEEGGGERGRCKVLSQWLRAS
jgi:hypothetical protein